MGGNPGDSTRKICRTNTSILNFEAASKASVHDAKAAALFGTMGGSIDAEKIYSIEPAKARPHISPLAWAQFEAYRAMLGFSVSQFTMLKFQIENPQDLLNFQGIIDLGGHSAPASCGVLKSRRTKGQVHLVDELEQAILQELKRVLSGADDDAQAIDLAAAILAKAEHVNAELTEARKVEKKHGGKELVIPIFVGRRLRSGAFRQKASPEADKFKPTGLGQLGHRAGRCPRFNAARKASTRASSRRPTYARPGAMCFSF